jgi:cysteinyl-tRNA synthetase
MESEKMSKSLGNVIKPNDLLQKGVKGEVIRYALMTGHYRAPLDWTAKLLENTQRSMDRLYGVLRRLKAVKAAEVDVPAAVLDALLDDLNTPKALAALFEIAGRANKAESEKDQAQAKGELLAAGRLLGLFETDPDAWFGLDKVDEALRVEIDQLLAERLEARQAKDFAKADAIREILTSKNVQVDDGPEGATWRLKG